ncbi:MAG: DMT family transporter [Bacillota bacterium]|nr:DMT family transporter [Bacillota bacterium]
MTKGKNFTKAILAAIGVYTLWGFSFMASDVGQRSVTPFTLLAYRFDIAVLLLTIPILLGKKKIRLKGKNIKPMLLLGTMEPCLYFIGEQYGLRYTNSAFSGVMIAVIPIVTLIMAAIFLKDSPSKAQWLFSALSIGGIVVITLSENSGGGISFVGVLCLVLAVLTGSAYGVLSRSLRDEFDVYERTYIMQVMGAVFYTVLMLIEQKGQLGAVIEPLARPDFVLSILYLAVGASVIGYTLFNYAVSNAPMANTIIFCNLTTVLSVAAGIVILGDPFSVVSIIAMAVVLVGIWGVQKFTPNEE